MTNSRNGVTMVKFYLIGVLSLISVTVFSQILFAENFNQPDINLKETGWLLDKMEKRIRMTVNGLEVDVPRDSKKGKKTFIKRTIPCKYGKFYNAEVMIKTENVKPWNHNQRGATIFIGLLDSTGKWVTGGGFPRGLTKTSDWQRVVVPLVQIDNPSVKYLQIWLGIEGSGKAWFRDLNLCEVKLNQDFEINTANNPITFKFDIPQTLFHTAETAVTLELHKKDSGESFLFFINQNDFTLPHGLRPGIWEAVYTVSSYKSILFQTVRTFSLETLPLPEAYTAKACFPNGVYCSDPELEIQFYPMLPANSRIVLTCNGKNIPIFRRNHQAIYFHINQEGKLNSGTYPIHLTAGNRKYEFIYNNRAVKHTITFRDDKIMILDGKPFFPISTYRDPSDKLYTFTGVKEAGFNMTHSYVFEEKAPDVKMAQKYLAACHKNGVLSFLGISRKSLRNRDFKSIQTFCAALSGEDTAFLWYLIDEPYWQKISPYYVREYYRTIKEIVPQIPVIQLHTPIKKGDPLLAFYGREGDIFWHDNYPVPGNALDEVRRDAMTATEVAPSQAIWSVIQVFDPERSAVRNKKVENVEPKAGKIRCMTHLAIAGGARGIIFYWLPKLYYDLRIHAPIQWAEVCAVSKELNELMPFLTGRDVNLQLVLPSAVKYWIKNAGSKTALTLINSEEKTVSFDLMVFNERRKISLNAYEVQILMKE